ncbi:ScyD/ScyE family protein [Isoptericola jiangsuensis]|uniref:ScyD/ScyE family protein n=1 Tax=Isoptericola jiangsuensis TaxID=548579 RepID=UPI003AADF7E3
MRRALSVCAAATAALVLVAAPATAHGSKDPRPPASETITSGLVTPLSLAVGPKGTTFVSQNFAGLLTAVDRDGDATVIHASADGAEVGALSYADGVVTFAESGADLTLRRLKVSTKGEPRGEARTVADLGAYEEAKNPDGKVVYGFRSLPASCAAQFPEDFPASYPGIVESHPYATTSRRGTTYVADAAGNTILSVDSRGKIRTVAVLPAQPVKITAEVAAGQGLPDCVVGKKYWFEPVPTDVEVGPLGLLYVSLLPGGPEDASLGARGSVVVVSPWTGRVHTVADDLLSPTGVAVDSRGTVYVAQLFGGEISKLDRRGSTPVASVALPGDVELDGSDLLATVNVLPPDETSPPDGQLVRYSLSKHGHR